MLVLPATLTHTEAPACAEMLRATLRTQSGTAAAAVVVDAAALTHFDSSALAVLLDCRRAALAAGRTFSVRGLPERLAALAQLYGVSLLLPAAAA